MSRKSDLIRQLGNSDPSAARGAIQELDEQGWLYDGSLRRANLQGISLRDADLEMADLREANLTRADLRHAKLRGLNFEKADLSEANVSDANLCEANLQNALLADANLKGARVDEAQLALAELLVGATMPDGKRYDGRYNRPGDLDLAREKGIYPDQPERIAEWYGVRQQEYEDGQAWADEWLDSTVGDGLVLLEANLEWLDEARQAGEIQDGTLKGADLRDMNLSGCDLSGAKLRGANLERMRMVRTNLSAADLTGAKLIETDLTRADLSSANLIEADLGVAVLEFALLKNANLTHANLFSAMLTDADLSGATVIDDQLVWANTLAGATMPDGSRYDGRYNLDGDVEDAEDSAIDPEDAEQMAAYYDVEQSTYESGQHWAKANLERLLDEEDDQTNNLSF